MKLASHLAAVYAVIGLANFCLLLLEVTAGRLLALIPGDLDRDHRHRPPRSRAG